MAASSGPLPDEPAPPTAIVGLRRRREFLAAARGRKAPTRSLVVQARPNHRSEIGLGFTVSRKVGNAVERNRVRRRLRQAARAVLPHCAVAGHDYVVIGRRAALAAPWPQLVADLKAALARLHRVPRTDGG